MKLAEIKKKIENALIELYINDSYLLENNGSERSIAHCLANALKLQFTDYDVDCEYNINFDNDSGKKEIFVLSNELEKFNKRDEGREKLRLEDEDYYSVCVYPDIIIHQRGPNENNLIIFEIKKSTSNIKDEYDELKLQKYTENDFHKSLRYQFGAKIKIFTKCKDSYKFEVTFYQNGQELEQIIIKGNSKKI